MDETRAGRSEAVAKRKSDLLERSATSDSTEETGARATRRPSFYTRLALLTCPPRRPSLSPPPLISLLPRDSPGMLSLSLSLSSSFFLSLSLSLSGPLCTCLGGSLASSRSYGALIGVCSPIASARRPVGRSVVPGSLEMCGFRAPAARRAGPRRRSGRNSRQVAGPWPRPRPCTVTGTDWLALDTLTRTRETPAGG